MDVSEKTFKKMNMKQFNFMVEATKEKQRMRDYENWVSGLYIKAAIASTLDSKNKYPDEPFLKEEEGYIDASNFSEEEKQKLREQLFGKLQGLMDEHERAEKLKHGG